MKEFKSYINLKVGSQSYRSATDADWDDFLKYKNSKVSDKKRFLIWWKGVLLLMFVFLIALVHFKFINPTSGSSLSTELTIDEDLSQVKTYNTALVEPGLNTSNIQAKSKSVKTEQQLILTKNDVSIKMSHEQNAEGIGLQVHDDQDSSIKYNPLINTLNERVDIPEIDLNVYEDALTGIELAEMGQKALVKGHVISGRNTATTLIGHNTSLIGHETSLTENEILLTGHDGSEINYRASVPGPKDSITGPKDSITRAVSTETGRLLTDNIDLIPTLLSNLNNGSNLPLNLKFNIQHVKNNNRMKKSPIEMGVLFGSSGLFYKNLESSYGLQHGLAFNVHITNRVKLRSHLSMSRLHYLTDVFIPEIGLKSISSPSPRQTIDKIQAETKILNFGLGGQYIFFKKKSIGLSISSLGVLEKTLHRDIEYGFQGEQEGENEDDDEQVDVVDDQIEGIGLSAQLRMGVSFDFNKLISIELEGYYQDQLSRSFVRPKQVGLNASLFFTLGNN